MRFPKMRFRDLFMSVGSGIVLLALVTSDPDIGFLQALPFGGSTLAGLLIFSKSIFALAFAHYGRKALFDYPEGDFQTAAKKALETSVGAGLLCISYSVFFLALIHAFSRGL